MTQPLLDPYWQNRVDTAQYRQLNATIAYLRQELAKRDDLIAMLEAELAQLRDVVRARGRNE